MKTLFILISTILMTIAAKSAIVSTNISNQNFNELISTTNVVWRIDLVKSANGNTQLTVGTTDNGYQTFNQSGGTNTISINSFNLQDFVVKIGGFDELYRESSPYQNQELRFGNTTILIQVGENSTNGSTEFSYPTLGSATFRNLSSESHNTGFVYDQIKITGIEGDFTLGGTYSLSNWASVNNSFITIVGLSNVPEPSTFSLIGLLTCLVTIRRSR